jgi:hypothetical protein
LGFCWTGFFLPTLWALSEGLWRPFALSLPFFFANQFIEVLASSCEQGEFCTAIPFVAVFRLICFVGYLCTMGYFGYNGEQLLIDDLLQTVVLGACAAEI